MSAIRVRALVHGEEALWFAVRPPRSGVIPRFADDPGFRPGSRLLAERDDVPAGRMELILEPPHEVLLVDPVVADGEGLAEVAGALVAAGFETGRTLGVRATQLLLNDRAPRSAELLVLAPSWGLVPAKTKTFHRATAETVRWDAAPLPDGHSFRPAAGPDDPHLVATLARVLEGSYEDDEDAASIVASCADRCRQDRCLHPEDWQVLECDGRALGVVIPAFADASHEVATNLWMGLVPEARGRGLGAPLQLHGLATLRRRGATRFISSCDVRNAAMQRVFERLGYERGPTQHYLRPRVG